MTLVVTVHDSTSTLNVSDCKGEKKMGRGKVEAAESDLSLVRM